MDWYLGISNKMNIWINFAQDVLLCDRIYWELMIGWSYSMEVGLEKIEIES